MRGRELAGASLDAGALCREFGRAGCRVAPVREARGSRPGVCARLRVVTSACAHGTRTRYHEVSHYFMNLLTKWNINIYVALFILQVYVASSKRSRQSKLMSLSRSLFSFVYFVRVLISLARCLIKVGTQVPTYVVSVQVLGHTLLSNKQGTYVNYSTIQLLH